jgi:peptidoglycan-associated lipoprotein
MKKLMVTCIGCALLLWSVGCAKKAVSVEPPAQPGAPAVEKVEEATPRAENPALNEQELFEQKTIADLNRDGALKRIHFDFDEYQIREDMKALLQANAEWLLHHGTVEVLIEGHCDERGTEEYNIALGEKRAEAAKNYLASLGVKTAKIKIVSYGKSRPLVTGTDEASFYENRRDEFVITKK